MGIKTNIIFFNRCQILRGLIETLVLHYHLKQTYDFRLSEENNITRHAVQDIDGTKGETREAIYV
jgi:hypothetical protein